MARNMTKRQAGIYLYIFDYINENNYPPTVREIADAFGIKSTNGVVEHLKALARKGYIEKGSFKSRALKPVLPREEALSVLHSGEKVPSKPIARHSELPASTKLTKPQPQTMGIPVVGNIAAGTPIFAEQNFEDTLAIDPTMFSRSGDGVYALHVRGTSMIGDGIMPGDVVIVRPQQTAEDGELIAAMLDGSATVKRYERRRDDIWLIPSNPNMDPIVIHPEDQIEFKILGAIRGVIRFYR